MVVVFVYVLFCIGGSGGDLEKLVVVWQWQMAALVCVTVGLAEMDNTVFIAALMTSSSEQIEL